MKIVPIRSITGIQGIRVAESNDDVRISTGSSEIEVSAEM